jgi:undecaprenyl-diphosphatase
MHSEEGFVGDQWATSRWTLGLWAVAVAVFVVIAIPALRDLVQPVDEWFREYAIQNEWAPAVFVAKALRIVGSGWVMIPFEVGVGIWLFNRRRRNALVFWAVSIGLVEAIVWSSKALYDRPRPSDALVSTTGASFPSGHSATAAVVAIGLVLVLAPITRNRWHWFAAAAGWATLMAASRVYLRAHWLTDVVAGATLGAAVALTIALLVVQWSDRDIDRKNEPKVE